MATRASHVFFAVFVIFASAFVACGGKSSSGSGGSGASGTGATGAQGGSTGTGGSGGDAGTTCGAKDCASSGLACCGSTCVNPDNDIHNCGACGVVCSGTHPYCNYGKCMAPPCSKPPEAPPTGTFCCGDTYCNDGQLCCSVPMTYGQTPTARCYAPTAAGTCPGGCTGCT